MDKTVILVLCTGNSCRSQMAEGFFREYGGSEIEVYSAGISSHGVNPKAIMVMADIGIDITHHKSESFERYLQTSFDFVITVCDNAAKSCPIFPGPALRLHWPFEDPAQAKGSEDMILVKFREVRDQIRQAVTGWLTDPSNR